MFLICWLFFFSSYTPPRSRRASSPRRKDLEDRCKPDERSRHSNNTIIPLTGIPVLGENSNTVSDTVSMSGENVNDFHYAEGENSDYYYTGNNLTYPPRLDETPSSPKRLSLDDRYILNK